MDRGTAQVLAARGDTHRRDIDAKGLAETSEQLGWKRRRPLHRRSFERARGTELFERDVG